MYYNNPPRTEVELQGLIRDGVEESDWLEYKANGALGKNSEKREEITKDVSGMANAGGGLLIYGIREKAHLPEEVQ